MSTSILPPEILLLIAREIEQNSDLQSFTLVSKTFRNVSKSILWSSVSLNINSGKLDRLSELTRSDQSLGELVKSLDIYSAGEEDGWRIEGNRIFNERSPPPEITVSNLTQLAMLFPNITSLCSSSCGGAEIFDTRQLALDFTFYSLTFFSYNASQDRELNLFRHILAVSPNLNSLNLYGIFDSATDDSARFPTVTNCPVLKNFSITTYSRFHIFDLYQPLFTPITLSNLESFNWSSSSQTEDLNPVLNLNCSTLKILDYTSQSSFNNISQTLPNLVALQSLKIFSTKEIPVNLLQLIPTQMQKLSVRLTRAQLEHFSHNPRPKLKLKEITLQQMDDWKIRKKSKENSIYNLIPNSVETLIIDHTIQSEELLEIYSNLKRNQINSSLKIISISWKGNYWCKADRAIISDPIVLIFENIGIKLKIPPWDTTYDYSC